MIYAYIRVSTDKQNTQNQLFEINQFCRKHQIKADRYEMETVSSTRPLEKRKLQRLVRKLRKDDILIASELSRLGRNLLQVMSILHHCMNVGAQVWTIKDNYRLGANIQSKVLAFAFSLSAEIERNLISQRTKEALQRLKAEGRHLGRPVGSRNRSSKLAGQLPEIQRLLDNRFSKTEIARIYGVSRMSIYKALRNPV